MKRIAIVLCALALMLLLSACAKCSVCGKEENLVDCPICYAPICESCADPYLFEERASEYLIGKGYVVYKDKSEEIEDLICNETATLIEALNDSGFTVTENE